MRQDIRGPGAAAAAASSGVSVVCGAISSLYGHLAPRQLPVMNLLRSEGGYAQDCQHLLLAAVLHFAKLDPCRICQ